MREKIHRWRCLERQVEMNFVLDIWISFLNIWAVFIVYKENVKIVSLFDWFHNITTNKINVFDGGWFNSNKASACFMRPLNVMCYICDPELQILWRCCTDLTTANMSFNIFTKWLISNAIWVSFFWLRLQCYHKIYTIYENISLDLWEAKKRGRNTDSFF